MDCIASSITSSQARAKRQSMQHLSPAERMEERKLRNTESARRNRQRRKQDDVRMEDVYIENERKIALLERRVSQLNAELKHQ